MAVRTKTWSERNNQKKRAFREKYGRKPTKQEIKMLKRDQIDLGSRYGDPRLLQPDYAYEYW